MAGVAWFPLGYNDLYRPPYPVGNRYLRAMNVTNTRIDDSAELVNRAAGHQRRYINHGVAGADIGGPQSRRRPRGRRRGALRRSTR